MIDFLNFELCKANGRSRFIKIKIKEDGVYLTTAYGYKGMYLEDSFTYYRSPVQSAWLISVMFEDLKIGSWPKAIPADYVPGKYLIGCDTDSWSLHYREQGKKRTRHIHGRGPLPKEPPFYEFIKSINHISPERDWLKWIAEDGDAHE